MKRFVDVIRKAKDGEMYVMSDIGSIFGPYVDPILVQEKMAELRKELSRQCKPDVYVTVFQAVGRA